MTTQGGLFDVAAAPQAVQPTAAMPVPAAFPEWLRRRLVAAGVMDDATGATRRARARRCDTCRAVVMLGIDADWSGIVSAADPTPLSWVGEAQASMAGRVTFELAWTTSPSGLPSYELNRRNPSRIRGRPAGTPGMDVLAQHECRSTMVFDTCATAIRDSASPTAILPDKPPF